MQPMPRELYPRPPATRQTLRIFRMVTLLVESHESTVITCLYLRNLDSTIGCAILEESLFPATAGICVHPPQGAVEPFFDNPRVLICHPNRWQPAKPLPTFSNWMVCGRDATPNVWASKSSWPPAPDDTQSSGADTRSRTGAHNPAWLRRAEPSARGHAPYR